MARKKRDNDGIERLNISELSLRFNIERATVRNRIREAEIQPSYSVSKTKVYELTPELEAALTRHDPDIEAEKLRKIRAEADLKEAQVRKEKGELVETGDVTEYLTRLFGGLHKEITIRFPRRVAAKLARTKATKDVTLLLQAELGKIFDTARTNHKRFLTDDDDGDNS